MTIDDISSICKSMPNVTQDIKWEHDLVFSIGGKMFCVVGLDQIPTTASFKVTDEEFEEVSNWPGFKPAPYVAKYKWVFIDDISKMNKSKWEQFLRQSYNLVRAKLPPKTIKQLDL
jgi:predicted DNA-binding protein (MmcQ/YjbR family)